MNNNVDKQYFELLQHIISNGVVKKDRTGTGTISVFDYTMRFNMSEGFPLLTSKKMFMKGVVHELIWFLRGDTNIKYLVENGVHIWDGDAYKNYIKNNGELSKDEFIDKIKSDDEFAEHWGELGPVYGKQWRNWNGVDQIQNLINDLKNNPDSRRLMVNAWNVGDIDEMVLPPCHYGFQCYTTEMNLFERKKYWCDSIGKNISYAEDLVDSELDRLGVPKRKLSLKWMQRSCDVPLGIPFNIASYGLLLELLAKEVNMIAHELIFSGGDCHIYLNQIDGIKEQIRNETFPLPKIMLKNKSIFELRYEDVEILNYKSSKSIKLPLSN
jgi:thymidylate synthase